MNGITCYASSVALFALIGVFNMAHADDEARFGALRTKVEQLKPHESNDVLDRIEKTAPHITACPNEEPMNSNLGVGVNGVEYLYTNIATSQDDQYYCFYMIKPFRRALTIDEGRDFSAALMMPDMPRFMPRFTSAAELARRAKAGEKHFIALRALVQSGTASALDPEDTSIEHRDIGDLDNLTDCSRSPIAELDARGNGSYNNRTLYNDVYYWRDLDPDDARCIFMISPFKRGLTAAEARDFLHALNLNLGMSDEFRSRFPHNN
jgi:hypothetical protein